jgi:flagellar protein FliO/FliZ
MDATGILKAAFALAVVLGLILALAYGLRRYAPNVLARLSSPRGRKRLEVLETLVLDPTRRVVMVRVDNEERLILLGEGRELIEPRPHTEMKTAEPKPQSPHKTASPVAEVPAPRPRPVAVAPKAQAPAPAPISQAARAKLAAARTAYAHPAVQDPNDDLF